MGYLDEALDEVKRATPTTGVNVCIYDDFEDVGDKLETIGNFDTVEEAQDFIDNYEGEAELVMYEAEIYEAEEEGTSDGAKKGWQTRQHGGKTKLNTRLPSYTPQKNHSISNYISMAEDDYEKGTTRDNDEYEKINYHSNSKFNAPHRTIYEEKLNKDGTGVKRATRGLNPKKTPAKVLQFVYVSKSECDICREYDGKTFATDSPNRPIIPRLESQGNRGSRPYTHPNCKCKWVRPFSDAGIRNFDQIRGTEDYDSITASLYKYAHKKYGKKFDILPKSRKHYILMQELMRKLKSDESFDPTSLPIASMLKMTYDAIEPTLALRLAKMTHKHTNEVRDLIDDMVGESLSSERKHDIVLEHNLDFTFENLLELTTLALFEAYSDEHDVWDEEKNTLVDPSLLEDKEEGDEGIDDEPYMPDVYGIDPYPHRHEFIDSSCTICDYELKATENMIYDENGVWQPKPEERMFTNGSIMALQSHFEELEGYKSHEGGVTLCKICNNLFDTYSKFSDHYQTHSKKEQGMERDHSKPYTDKFGKRHVSWTCPKCGEEFGIAGHSGEGEQFEHIMSHESKATEIYTEEDEIKRLDKENNELEAILSRMKASRIEMLKIDIRIEQKRLEDIENNTHPDEFYELYNERVKAQLLSHSKRKLEKYKQELKELTGESKASEGGRGSGRKGHQKWMLGAEADPEECPNCMIFTERKNGNCQICGNSY